ncbi:(2Fe-2S)-binding protein [Polynucleobacter sp. AP-Elch-400A-B2]|uniref:(2Fe-2S)-binding protein n=1 Tax=Polynucleobacter sp. AP-Elch-400A-B2 TaxID=2576930 RepID=UPI001BFDF954|nr:(2Fe-2S)-binding protein [Polynucleobacter sp. AP-Elch-400A-B2]QWE25181.1 (2Fe-2S)-binding protein [Polynucleobacter sp. AP-Elch-400A-B2]
MTDLVVLRVNGVSYSIAAEPNTPLLYILRNDLQLFGARFGCGLGLCGACSVLINGQKMHSCDVPLWDCVGKDIVTIEGVGTPDKLHALQQAIIDEQAMQCGYCVNGILITAKALLDQNPNPTELEIREALDRNLCRCGTHNRFIRAIQKVVAINQSIKND